MVTQSLGNLFAHGHDRVQGGKRILKYHGDLAAADVPQIGLGKFKQVHTFKQDLPRRDYSIQWSKQAEDAERGNALTAAAFTDNPNRLSMYERKRHVIHRVQDAARCDELRAQVFDFQ
jgi:hypothetical protein